MLTIRQAAERLGVSPDLVYRLCQEGIIPHRRCRAGLRTRTEIEQSEIEHYRRLCRLGTAELTPAHFFRSSVSD